MKKKIISIVITTLLVTIFLSTTVMGNDENEPTPTSYPATTPPEEYDFGDAPEGPTAIAYPSTGMIGSFPTCINCGPAMWVQHTNFGGYFGPGVDFEVEGNGGFCPQCFPPYDMDETFQDGDAGLIMPEPFTIDNYLNVVPFPGFTGTPLGFVGQPAVWGTDVDIFVHNTMPNHEPYVEGYVNVLIDWNQNGIWSDQPGEHVLIDFYIPPLYIGPLSGLTPPGFTIGPNAGYVWTRFSITEKPVGANWNGEGGFEDGESEDYLLQVENQSQPIPDLDCNGSLSWTSVQPGSTVTGTFAVGNIGQPGSLLNWQITGYPSWGTWTFNPPSGTGLAAGSWVTVTATCVAPSDKNKLFTGTINVTNLNDPTDNCTISVSLKTPLDFNIHLQLFFQKLLQQFPHAFPILKYLLGY